MLIGHILEKKIVNNLADLKLGQPFLFQLVEFSAQHLAAVLQYIALAWRESYMGSQ